MNCAPAFVRSALGSLWFGLNRSGSEGGGPERTAGTARRQATTCCCCSPLAQPRRRVNSISSPPTGARPNGAESGPMPWAESIRQSNHAQGVRPDAACGELCSQLGRESDDDDGGFSKIEPNFRSIGISARRSPRRPPLATNRNSVLTSRWDHFHLGAPLRPAQGPRSGRSSTI